MKTRIATITLILGVFFTTNTMANMPVPASKNAVKEVSKYLEDELTYPHFASKTEQIKDASVSIIIQEDGSLKVESASCKSYIIRNHVIKEINNLKKNPDFVKYANQNVVLRIKYKLLI